MACQSTEPIIPAFAILGIVDPDLDRIHAAFGLAAAEIAVTCPLKGFGSASVVTVCGLPSLMRPMAVSGTPKTALTVCVSASEKPLVAGADQRAEVDIALENPGVKGRADR